MFDMLFIDARVGSFGHNVLLPIWVSVATQIAAVERLNSPSHADPRADGGSRYIAGRTRTVKIEADVAQADEIFAQLGTAVGQLYRGLAYAKVAMLEKRNVRMSRTSPFSDCL